MIVASPIGLVQQKNGVCGLAAAELSDSFPAGQPIEMMGDSVIEGVFRYS